MSLPPGPKAPTAVQTMRWIARPTQFMEACQRRYGEQFTVKLQTVGNVVLLTNPDQIRTVFTADARKLHAGEANVVLEPVVGSSSVLLLDEDDHIRQRRLLLPPFHGDRMRGYGETIRGVTMAAVADWPRGQVFPMRERTQQITLEVILHVIFGIDDADRLTVFRDRLNAMDPQTFKLIMLPFMRRRIWPGSPWDRFVKARDALDEVLYDEIAKRRADPQSTDRDDVLSMLLEARDEEGNGMTDVELRDELMTMVVAGHETTATALAWTFELLYRHPDAHKKVIAEALNDSFTYTDAVIQESLRLRPILPIVARRVKSPITIGQYEIPADTVLAPCIYLTHLRPDLYPDPHHFKPERFVDTPPDTYSWFPFGGGIRRCIGASFALFEMREILQTVLRQVQLESGSTEPEQVVRRAVTFAPEHDARTIVTSEREVVNL